MFEESIECLIFATPFSFEMGIKNQKSKGVI